MFSHTPSFVSLLVALQLGSVIYLMKASQKYLRHYFPHLMKNKTCYLVADTATVLELRQPWLNPRPCLKVVIIITNDNIIAANSIDHGSSTAN